MHNIFEMINQENIKFADPYFGICCRELGGSKLRVFAFACAVSALV